MEGHQQHLRIHNPFLYDYILCALIRFCPPRPTRPRSLLPDVIVLHLDWGTRHSLLSISTIFSCSRRLRCRHCRRNTCTSRYRADETHAHSFDSSSEGYPLNTSVAPLEFTFFHCSSNIPSLNSSHLHIGLCAAVYAFKTRNRASAKPITIYRGHIHRTGGGISCQTTSRDSPPKRADADRAAQQPRLGNAHCGSSRTL